MSDHNTCIRAADDAGRTNSTKADGPFSDLPSLIGSQRQVAWAAEIRQKAVGTFLGSFAGLDAVALDGSEAVLSELMGRTTAEWWIENARLDFTARSPLGKDLLVGLPVGRPLAVSTTGAAANTAWNGPPRRVRDPL